MKFDTSLYGKLNLLYYMLGVTNLHRIFWTIIYITVSCFKADIDIVCRIVELLYTKIWCTKKAMW